MTYTTTAFSPKRAVARSKRQLAAAVAQLRKVATEWDEIDNMFVYEAENLIKLLEDFSTQIGVEINDRLAAGEYVGL